MKLNKLLLTLLASTGLYASSDAQTARMQFINNCADVSVPSVDVYINGILSFNNLPFRTASIFKNITAGSTINIGIAPSTSTSVTDTFYNLPITLATSSVNIGIIDGIKSPSGYNPQKPFVVNIFTLGRELATVGTNTDLLFYNGATDAKTFDFRTGLKIIANDVAYNQYNSTGYYQLPTSDIRIRLTSSTGSSIYKTYEGNFQALGEMGQALVVLTSGFVDPVSNSNGSAFGLFYSRATGGPLQPLNNVSNESFARLQLIHNSADAALSTVDIYIDNTKTFDNISFRNATPFFDIYGVTPRTVGIAPANSSSVNDTLYSFTNIYDSAKTYIAVLNGTHDTAYHPNPGIDLNVYANARESATNGANTDMLFINGSTDAPDIDIVKNSIPLVSGLAYNNFTMGYTSMATANTVLNISKTSNNATIQDCTADFLSNGFTGEATTIVTSGFVNKTTNKNGPEFAVYAARASGGAMTLLPPVVGINDVQANNNIQVYPNPASGSIRINGLTNGQGNTYRITDMMGKTILNGILNNNIIDISMLTKGTYILSISNTKGESYHINLTKD